MPRTKKTARKKASPHQRQTDLAERFLATIFSVFTPGKIVIVRAEQGKWRRGERFDSTADAARRAVEASLAGADVYVGVGRNVGTGRLADDVERLTFAWADLDSPADSTEERRDLLDRLEEFDPAPSIVISSASGLQAVWLLREATIPKVVERINRVLCSKLDADTHMHITADALVRIPGTLGHYSHRRSYDPPRTINIVRLSVTLRYDVSDLRQRLRLANGAGAKQTRATASPAGGPKPAGWAARLLAAAEKQLEHATRKRDGRLVICCPFHDDQHESAVVFVNGWFHCSACGVNEPARQWTRRPEVRSWAEGLVPRVRRTATLPAGFGKLPRLAIRNAAAVLAPFPDRGAKAGRGDGWAWIARRGIPIGLGNPEQVARHARGTGGPLLERVWWACVVLAQDPTAAVGRDDPVERISRRDKTVPMSQEEAAVRRQAMIETAVHQRQPDPEKLAGQDLLRIVAAPNRVLELLEQEDVPEPGVKIKHEGVWNEDEKRIVAPYAIVPNIQYYRDAIDRYHDAVLVGDVRRVTETDHGFSASAGVIARLLGYKMTAGRVPTKVRRAIDRALLALGRIQIAVRLSGKTQGWFEAPLVDIVGKNEKGLVCRLHPGVLLQIRRGPAWAPFDPRALKLRDEETLAAYLELVWRMADAKSPRLEVPLSKIAIRAGVWNATRAKKAGKDYIQVWKQRIAEIKKLRLLDVKIIDEPAGDLVLRVQARGGLGRALRALAGRANRDRSGR
ncbi:MAG: hypothetical protein HY825_16090 [Acidobacteria bacterium]|nr:hypothetical protein [Acidobacteriota bacterium]